MNPLPPILSLVAIAGGVLGGLELASAVAPPAPSAQGRDGSDAESLFRRSPLFFAIQDAERELGTNRPVAQVTIEPDALDVKPPGGARGELELDDLPLDAPVRIVASINRARERAGRPAITLDDVESLTWRPTEPARSEWRIRLDAATAGPPAELVASRDGSTVRTAGADG